jgi:hypothetical protein
LLGLARSAPTGSQIASAAGMMDLDVLPDFRRLGPIHFERLFACPQPWNQALRMQVGSADAVA